MKKYSHLYIALIILAASVIGIEASAQTKETSASASPAPLTPAEERAFREERVKITQRAQLKAQQEIENKRKAVELEIRTKRAQAEAEMQKEREAMQKEIMLQKGALNGQMQAKKAEVQELKSETQADIKKYVRAQVAASFVKRVDNLTQIAGRINTRIEKLEAAQVDTARAQSLLQRGEESIALAKTNAAGVKAAIDADSTLETIKTKILATKEALMEAHEYLVQSVRELQVQVKTNASVNANVSNTPQQQ